MKTLTFATLLILFSWQLLGQTGRVIFSEDFNSGTPPWTLTNDANTPYYFQFTDAWIRFADDTPGDTCAASTSFFTPSASASRWMVFGPFNIEKQAFLSWEAQAANFQYADGYQVYVSEQANAPVSGVSPVFSTAEENDFWTPRSVNLDQLGIKDKTIYIAFVNNSYDKDILLIDNILLVDTTFLTVDFEILKDSTDNPFQTAIPYGQFIFEKPSTVVRNSGNTKAGSKIIVCINDNNGLLVKSDTISIPELEPGETFRTPPVNFSPTDTNSYTVTYKLTSDDRKSNNVVKRNLDFDNRYSSARLTKVDAFQVDQSEPGKVGTAYSYTRPDTILCIEYYVDNTDGQYTGATITGGIYAESSPGSYSITNKLRGTDTITIQAGFKGKIKLNVKGGGLPVSPGSYLFAVERGAYEPFSFSRDMGNSQENGSKNFVFYGSVTNSDFVSASQLNVKGNFAVEAVSKRKPCFLEVDVDEVEARAYKFEDGRPDSIVSGELTITLINGTPPITANYVTSIDGSLTPIDLPTTVAYGGYTDHYLDVNVRDAAGCVFFFTVSIRFREIFVESPIGVSTRNPLENRVWPNPTYGLFTIETDEEQYSLSLFGTNGQKVYIENITGSELIDISSLPGGIYMGVLENNKKVSHFRLVKL